MTAAVLTESKTARVLLDPDLAGTGMLDGGWWPRSTDPVTELPELIAYLDERIGSVYRIALNHGQWDSTPPKLTVGRRVVKLGWYGPKDVHEISLSSAAKWRIDLLVVPPSADPDAAEAALAVAADPASRARASAILAARQII